MGTPQGVATKNHRAKHAGADMMGAIDPEPCCTTTDRIAIAMLVHFFHDQNELHQALDRAKFISAKQI